MVSFEKGWVLKNNKKMAFVNRHVKQWMTNKLGSNF